MEIRVPQLAEGVETATVVSISISVGDKITPDQTVVELESNKAVASVPSPAGGTVEKIHISEGDEVKVGQLLVSLSSSGKASTPQPKAPAAPAPQPAASVSQPQPKATSPSGYQYQSSSGFPPPASPSVRKMAAALGIDLTRIRGSEKGGRITLDDVKSYLQALQQGAGAAPAASAPTPPPSPAIDFSKWGKVSRKKLTPLRKAISQAMAGSWSSVPRVTQFEDVDITDLMALRKKYAGAYEKAGARLTLTPFIIRAIVNTLKNNLIFNSSLDDATQEIVTKEYYNIGIAVDTEQGLIVPVIKNADQKSLLELSKELMDLAEKTRDRKVPPEDLQGGTFTLSNQGGIGGSYFTPIVNKPEVAILGIGQGRLTPLVVNKKITPRLTIPLGLSYDHRVIDGAQAARFISEFGDALKGFGDKDVQLTGSSSVKTSKTRKVVKKGKK